MQDTSATATRRRSRPPDPRRSSIHSKMVLERKTSVADIAASLAVQSTTVSKSLTERLGTVLEAGEEMPDVKLLLELLGRLAQRSADELDQADDHRCFAEMQVRSLRQAIAESQTELHVAAVAVRKTLVDLYGAARCRCVFGWSERTPRSAVDLAIETRRLVDRLSDPRLTLPEPEVPGVAADPEGWIAWLAPTLERLEQALVERDRRQIAAEDGVIAKQRALVACDETYRQVARTAEALFTLAGETELARRLRPEARARARSVGTTPPLRPLAGVRTTAAACLQRARAAVGRLATAFTDRRRDQPNLRFAAVWRLARGSTKTPIA